MRWLWLGAETGLCDAPIVAGRSRIDAITAASSARSPRFGSTVRDAQPVRAWVRAVGLVDAIPMCAEEGMRLHAARDCGAAARDAIVLCEGQMCLSSAEERYVRAPRVLKVRWRCLPTSLLSYTAHATFVFRLFGLIMDYKIHPCRQESSLHLP